VGFDQVLDSLVTHALELSPRMNELRIERTGTFGSLDPRIATPLALVITELIHNALEHGLAEEGSVLGIHVAGENSEIQVIISDDGVGLPEGFNIAKSPNLGLQIVRTLTENELSGTLSLVSDQAQTKAILVFPNTK
jgi:two-component sensor histidine kinase